MRTHLIFDFDNTLTRSDQYFKHTLIDYFLETRDYDNLEYLAAHAEDNVFELPQNFIDIVREKAIKRELYMLEASPTKLYRYYFLTPGNLNSRTKVSICTNRGITPNGMAKSTQWLKTFKPCCQIEDIHMLDPRKTPSKLDYLSNVYGNDFLLIDDDPFYDISKVHEKDHRVAVYEEETKYVAYQNQNKIVFDGKFYRVNNKIIR